ncbi:MAG: hypothetical protein MRY72_02065 [Aquisalinus sp.]|nr:hypothetical protein [Aquisalinus sp.]
MTALITVTALYDGNADAIFREAMNLSELVEAMSGLATYEGLPEEPAKEGETYTVDVTMWGFLKTRGHVMHVETLDYENRIIQSREHNPAIRRWDHNLSVQPLGDKVLWTDQIELDAGWRTFGAARFCAYVYQRRHKYRKALKITRTIGKAG